jgi:hypothetical protein
MPQRTQMAARLDAPMAGNDRRKHWNQCRNRQGREDETGPQHCLRQQAPACDQRREGGRCRQGAPEIVEHLPAAEQRQSARIATLETEDPGQQLPVAARPAMVASDCNVVTGRKFLDHFDVGDESRAGERAFEQIVAEERPFRYTTGQRGLEGIDVVDALACV